MTPPGQAHGETTFQPHRRRAGAAPARTPASSSPRRLRRSSLPAIPALPTAAEIAEPQRRGPLAQPQAPETPGPLPVCRERAARPRLARASCLGVRGGSPGNRHPAPVATPPGAPGPASGPDAGSAAVAARFASLSLPPNGLCTELHPRGKGELEFCSYSPKRERKTKKVLFVLPAMEHVALFLLDPQDVHSASFPPWIKTCFAFGLGGNNTTIKGQREMVFRHKMCYLYPWINHL